jgi:hypothetical protein
MYLERVGRHDLLDIRPVDRDLQISSPIPKPPDRQRNRQDSEWVTHLCPTHHLDLLPYPNDQDKLLPE